MPYAYAPPDGFAAALGLVGAYTPPPGFAAALALRAPLPLPAANDDTYATGKHFPLHVVAPGVLDNDSDPAGLGLVAHLDVDVAHGTLTLDSDGGFHYVPDGAFLGTDSFTYYVTDSNGLDSDPATVSIEVSQLPVQRDEQISAGLPWSVASPRLRAVLSGFSRSARVRRSEGFPFASAPPVRRTLEAPLSRAARLQGSPELPFGEAPKIHARSVEVPSRRAARLEVGRDLAWSTPPAVGITRALPYRHPARVEHAAEAPWSKPPTLGRGALAPYRHPPKLEGRWLLPWSHAPAVQWHVRGRTVTPPHTEPPQPMFDPGPGFAIAPALTCPWLEFPGFAVPVPLGPAACYLARPRPRSYIVLNTATIIATVTGYAIEASAFSIGESIDDTHHSFSITLADPADLDWLKPTVDGPIAIEINVNGYVRTGVVEDWSTEQVFPGQSITVTGRARTALLDAPYAPQRAYIEGDDRTSQQLVDQELDSTGFTADYGILDWEVPAGVWHYDAMTPIAAVRAIAAAAGGVARSHPWDDVIELLPRYPHSPWAWSTTSPDKTVVYDYVPRQASRDGTSGVPSYELRIPLWPSSDATKPGLVRPGQLLEFAALAGWKAQVVSVRINASVEQAGGAAALIVWQDITLEAPPAEPRYDYVLVSGEQAGVSDPVIRDGTAGLNRLPQIVDALITEHAVAAERGRNAIAGGGDARALTNVWAQLVGLQPQGRYLKGNVLADHGDGTYAIATCDGATSLARALPGQTWSVTDGVFVQDGRIVDSAPSLPGITQTV
ncbi:MAG: Ig-like domain-containing protein [Dokdonella sp.]|uniref:Ig-like domain-containing protein n=1 Tax=Dokdonella sp. TaxID=2291710 RepID=UPI003F7F080B